jgi:Uncharacterized protein conserved in bacteria (DUF2332)
VGRSDSEQAIADDYRRFSREEARGRSPLYEELTRRVAEDPALLAFLAAQPPAKRQPNLLLAAVRYLVGTQRDFPSFRAAVLDHQDAVAEVLAQRRTQTNEPDRCAVLLPLLAQLPQPLALLEVGASAGLCLLPDRYGYIYGTHRVGRSDLVFPCTPHGGVPLPDQLPTILWRRGIDLDPIDVTNDGRGPLARSAGVARSSRSASPSAPRH